MLETLKAGSCEQPTLRDDVILKASKHSDKIKQGTVFNFTSETVCWFTPVELQANYRKSRAAGESME